MGVGEMEDKNEQVYSQYEINILSTYRVKGTTYLECDDGLRIIKAYDYSEKKAEIENEVKKMLLVRGYEYTDMFELNKSGAYITQNRYGNKFVVKKWFTGEECNLLDEEEVKTASSNLAKLHILLSECSVDESISDKIPKKNIMQDYNNYNKEMNRVKKYILKKKKKNLLEIEFLNSMDRYYESALIAVEGLKNNHYSEIHEESIKMKKMCHGAYNHHNIIIGENVAITNYFKVFYGVQIYDLYCFLRKTMEKNEWSREMGDIIINEYNKYINISNKELKILKDLLLYPEKYHKLVNSYYNSQKVWVSGRIQQKLNEIIRLENKKNLFIKEIFK